MRTLLLCSLMIYAVTAWCQEAPQVMVIDHGVTTGVIGPGAPAHTIGKQRYEHLVVMDTGVKNYGLRYVVAHDPEKPEVALPGEGYIGMPEPSAANWYHGGFFDLQLNGKSIGTTRIHSVTSRAVGARGYVDMVFDTPEAIVRIRFVTLAGSDALYCQALLEPKVEIKQLRVVTRCYPSAFTSSAERHVLTPTRDLRQGEKADLDLAQEWWLLYYDRLADAGQVGGGRTGVGPCAMLWPGSQADTTAFTVGDYGIDTAMALKPQLRDFRFIFFDFKGTRNEAATADLRGRAGALLQDLVSFQFTDDSVAKWPLMQKVAEIKQVLAGMPQEKESAANYDRWTALLNEQLQVIQSGTPGAIMAEANAAKTIQEWERGLPELLLKGLINEI